MDAGDVFSRTHIGYRFIHWQGSANYAVEFVILDTFLALHSDVGNTTTQPALSFKVSLPDACFYTRSTSETLVLHTRRGS